MWYAVFLEQMPPLKLIVAAQSEELNEKTPSSDSSCAEFTKLKTCKPATLPTTVTELVLKLFVFQNWLLPVHRWTNLYI